MSEATKHTPHNPAPPEENAEYLTGLPMIHISKIADKPGMYKILHTHVWRVPQNPEADQQVKQKKRENHTYSANTPGLSVVERSDCEHYILQAPQNIHNLVLSTELMAPIYTLIEQYLVPKANGATFTKEELEKINRAFSAASADWLVPMLSDNKQDFIMNIETADFERVGQMLMYCVDYFYNILSEELRYTLEDYECDEDTAFRIIQQAYVEDKLEECKAKSS